VRKRNDERERLKVGDPILKRRQILTRTSERCCGKRTEWRGRRGGGKGRGMS